MPIGVEAQGIPLHPGPFAGTLNSLEQWLKGAHSEVLAAMPQFDNGCLKIRIRDPSSVDVKASRAVGDNPPRQLI